MKNPGTSVRSWTGGANSLLPPDEIGIKEYAWGINVVNRGGLVQTRPGLEFLVSLQGRNLQGSIIFTPKESRPMMLVAIDGFIYYSKYPFKGAFAKVEGLKFLANAPTVTFQRCYKSVNRKPDGLLELVDPYALVVIQDGKTRAATFDGVIGKHVFAENPFLSVPIGLWMAWSGQRLWVSKGSRIFASDLANPDTFSENLYLAERSNFELPGEVTGMVETGDEKALLGFTASTTTAFKSSILDRVAWGETPDFQHQILPSVGCVAGRSPTNQYGLTWWFSRAGWISLDAALFTKLSNKLVTADGEMTRSKRILSNDLSGICSTHFENYLLVSVPAGGKRNEQTWVMDQAPMGQGNEGVQRAWCGVWTGVRPVQWMRTDYLGREHLYFVSHDATAKDGTNIHIWKAFKESREDNEGRISCQMETGMMTGAELNKFRYAEFEICELLGSVDLRVFVGGSRGQWYPVSSTNYQAQKGSIGSPIQQTITKHSILKAFKPQVRTHKTEEFSPQDIASAAESTDVAGRDKGFQLLIEWKGRMGIRSIKFVMEPDGSTDGGEVSKSESGEVKAISDTGETILQ